MNASEIRKLARENLAGRWKQAIIISLVFSAVIAILSVFEVLTEDVLVLAPIISLVTFILTLPLSYGFLNAMMKFKRKEDVSYTDFFKLGFANFGRTWKIFGNVLLKMLLLVILFAVFLILIIFGSFRIIAEIAPYIAYGIVPSTLSETLTPYSILILVGFLGAIVCSIWLIPKTYLYSLAYFIGIDNSEMSAKEVVEKSAELMNGYRWKYFCLSFSFIGWYLLVGLVYGILSCIFQNATILLPVLLCICYSFLIPYIMNATIIFYEHRAGKLDETTPKEKTEEPIQTNE